MPRLNPVGVGENIGRKRRASVSNVDSDQAAFLVEVEDDHPPRVRLVNEVLPRASPRPISFK